MSRSVKKGPYIDEKLLKKILKQKENEDSSPIKTWSRDSQIAPEFIGHKLAIHNGRKFIEVLMSESMIGHRLGEFSPTRTFRSHGKVTKKVISHLKNMENSFIDLIIIIKNGYMAKKETVPPLFSISGDDS